MTSFFGPYDPASSDTDHLDTRPPPDSGQGLAGSERFPGTEGLELEERRALRRVPGITTELQDVTEVEYRRLRLERVVLVGVWVSGTYDEAEHSLHELKALAETAGSQVLEGLVQRRDRPDPATYLGSGRARELRDVVVATGADTVVVDGELRPGQLRGLEEVVKVKVIDRTALILDIFAQHARSREGQAQVELARLEYVLPRLRGWGESMSRQAGGIGARRGPGETKIETDRRQIRNRVSKLRRDIRHMHTARVTKRQERRRREIPSVVIAGYTNAGKSSLLNRLTGAAALVEDALFATLDATVRRAETGDGRVFTVTDTVGFVRHLPHQLVEAFRSTLEEVADADLILHLVDGAGPDPEAQLSVVREVFGEIGAQDVPELVVVNKCDAAELAVLERLRRRVPGAVLVSARTGAGIEELTARINELLPRPEVEVTVLLPYDRGDLVDQVHRYGDIGRTEHTGAGTLLSARVPGWLAGELAKYPAVASPAR